MYFPFLLTLYLYREKLYGNILLEFAARVGTFSKRNVEMRQEEEVHSFEVSKVTNLEK